MENLGDFQANLVGQSSTMLHSLKGSSDSLSAQSGGLARYHSAPSSTFSALLEADFFSASDNAEFLHFLAQSGLSELAGYNDAGISLLKPITKPESCIKKKQPQHVYSHQNNVPSGLQSSGGGGARTGSSFHEHIGQGPLSAILEHAGEEALAPQPCQGDSPVSGLQKTLMDSSIHFKANLIRHSSLPSDFLSRLAMEEMSERPAATQQLGSHVQTVPQPISSNTQTTSQQLCSPIQTSSPRTVDNSGGKVYLVTSRMSPRGLPVRKSFTDELGPCKEEDYNILDNELNQHGLVRQSSSPAGLLSQLTLDEFAIGADKMGFSSAQGIAHAGWDQAAMDLNLAAFGQRKRGREAEGRLGKSMPPADLLMTSLDHHFTAAGTSSADSMATDAVLCKLRAKRGCATHPRSIAERVRRTKISERMKKLQDLVPNLDRQAHTADMLDEIVEYVKLLQRQVEELSKHSHECNGMCQGKGDDSDQK